MVSSASGSLLHGPMDYGIALLNFIELPNLTFRLLT